MNEKSQDLIMNKGDDQLLAKTVTQTDDPQTLRMVAGALANLCKKARLTIFWREKNKKYSWESLYVSMGKVVLSIVTKEGSFLGPEIPVFNVRRAGKMNGIEFITRHDDDVTVIQVDVNFSIAHLLSGSNYGMIKITEEDTEKCVASFKAHDGKPIHSANFIRHLADLVLITGIPENQELKLWITAGEQKPWLSNGFDS